MLSCFVQQPMRLIGFEAPTNYFNFVQQLTSVKSTQSVIITDNACMKDSQCIRQFDFVQFSSLEPCPLWQCSGAPIFTLKAWVHIVSCFYFCTTTIVFLIYLHFKLGLTKILTIIEEKKKKKVLTSLHTHTCTIQISHWKQLKRLIIMCI